MTQQPVGLFGLKVSPGEEVQLESMEDVRITNISFGEIVNGNARTVVRVHHRPVPSYDDSDDDSDDDEFDEFDEDGQEVDDEEDEDEDAKEEKAVEDEEEEEDEEDDEELEEEDDEEEEEEQTFVICSLYPGQKEQVTVDLHFSVDDDVRFSVTGENPVEIMGNYLSPGTFDDDPDLDELIDEEDDEEIDSDELEMLEGESSDEEDADLDNDDILVELDSDEDDEDEDEDRIHEIEIELPKQNGKKRSAAEADMSIDEEEAEDVQDATKLTKNQRKKLEKRLRADAESAAETSTASISKEKVAVAKKDSEKPAKVTTKETVKKDDKPVSKKVTLPSGVIIEDMKIGSGPQAKNGNRLGMRYVGRLANGKMFDSNTKGKPFTFKLGKGEVIGGWDQGLRGMQVGGERRLVIPPKQAYGARGAPPDIPKNATLTFDVKLVEIK